MTQEQTCSIHGPYSAALASCPYCAAAAGGRPQAPQPLDDEMPTDPRGGQGPPVSGGYDEEETDFGIRARERIAEDEETAWPQRRGSGWDDDETVVERQQEGPMGFLVVKEGISDAKIILRDQKVSRPHAKFTFENDHFTIWDFCSENGTFVNGQRIIQATPLKENDVIKIGDNLLVLKTLE